MKQNIDEKLKGIKWEKIQCPTIDGKEKNLFITDYIFNINAILRASDAKYITAGGYIVTDCPVSYWDENYSLSQITVLLHEWNINSELLQRALRKHEMALLLKKPEEVLKKPEEVLKKPEEDAKPEVNPTVCSSKSIVTEDRTLRPREVKMPESQKKDKDMVELFSRWGWAHDKDSDAWYMYYAHDAMVFCTERGIRVSLYKSPFSDDMCLFWYPSYVKLGFDNDIHGISWKISSRGKSTLFTPEKQEVLRAHPNTYPVYEIVDFLIMAPLSNDAKATYALYNWVDDWKIQIPQGEKEEKERALQFKKYFGSRSEEERSSYDRGRTSEVVGKVRTDAAVFLARTNFEDLVREQQKVNHKQRVFCFKPLPDPNDDAAFVAAIKQSPDWDYDDDWLHFKLTGMHVIGLVLPNSLFSAISFSRIRLIIDIVSIVILLSLILLFVLENVTYGFALCVFGFNLLLSVVAYLWMQLFAERNALNLRLR